MITLFPDSTALIVDYLDGLLGVPVRHEVPNPRPATFVTVDRGGGTRHTIVTDAPLVLLEAWAASPEAAMDLIQLARAYLHDLPGRVLDGHPVYRVDEAAGPANLPDPLSSQPRAVFTAVVHVRGLSAVGS